MEDSDGNVRYKADDEPLSPVLFTLSNEQSGRSMSIKGKLDKLLRFDFNTQHIQVICIKILLKSNH